MIDWESVEEYVFNIFKKIDKTLERTKGSGNVYNDTDSIGDTFLIEVKTKNTTDMVLLQKKEINEFKNKHARLGRIGIIAMCNKKGELFFVFMKNSFNTYIKICRKKGYIFSKLCIEIETLKSESISLGSIEINKMKNFNNIIKYKTKTDEYFIMNEETLIDISENIIKY